MALGRVLRSFAAPTTSPTGLAWKGRYLWQTEFTNDRIYQTDPLTGTVIRDFAAPDTSPFGMDFQGRHLLLVGSQSDRAYLIDPLTGTSVIDTPAPSTNPTGICVNGRRCMQVDAVQTNLYIMDLANGRVLDIVPIGAGNRYGCTWNGRNVLVCNDASPEVVEIIDCVTGTVIVGFNLPSTSPGGLVFNGRHLYVSDFASDLIYELELAHRAEHEKILPLGPIAHWPLWNPAGAVTACDISGNGYDSVAMVISTAGDPGIGDLSTSFEFDGANDYINVYSAGFAGAFLGTEVTVGIWLRVANAGVWTDGTVRYFLRLYADANNEVALARTAVNNTMLALYRAGGVSRSLNPVSASTDWIRLVMTASASADEFRVYLDGVQFGATLNGLGAWAGALNANFCIIGASSLVPANSWLGNLGHCFVVNRALSPAEVYNISVGYPQ